jgi:radical SAM protein with 4Fe4S-binding SPASM domain
MEKIRPAEVKAQFNYSDRVDLGAEVPLREPLVIYVEPSSFCNLECKFCPQHIGKGEFGRNNMAMDTFTKLVDDLKNFDKRPKLMRFCGVGDPLFNRSTGHFIRYAREQDVVERTELITNGVLLSEKNIPIIALNADRVVISVEGLSADDYLNFTLRNINFDKFVGGIRSLYEVPDRRCVVHVKIHNQSVLDNERKSRFFEIFNEICDEIYIENLVDLWPEKSSNLGINAGHRFDSGGVLPSLVCPQIFKSLQVNANGTVLPCCVDWKSINIMGDVRDRTLGQIWNDQPIRELRRKHLLGKRNEFSPCKGCNHNEYSEKDNLDSVRDRIYESYFGSTMPK